MPQAKVCKECPFRRKSPSGWLGSSTGPADFLNSFALGEAHLPCHMTVDWEADDAMAQAYAAPVCRGSLVMLKNSCKLPRNPKTREALEEVDPDHESVFSNALQFCAHHKPECDYVVFGNSVAECSKEGA